ncbi:MAG: rod shape-determining protein MreC [Burkholderiales bacterium]|nr:rod shape-determining protein MreC [Burkholderiales bacterium]
MEYSPPPFFKQGPSALARMAAFALLSLALLVADAQYRLLERVRYGVALALYPLQLVARAPGGAVSGFAGYMARQENLLRENAAHERRGLEAARGLMRAGQLEAENANLRALLAMRERLPVVSVAAELLYDARDPFTRKVVIDKGGLAGVKPGQVVVDARGVVGQVTRAFPAMAEVSLLTDRDQAIPVQVVRNGLRAVAYGIPTGPDGGALELKFLATNADVRKGDDLVTSGLDGVFLPGLPVASVTRVERGAGFAFARIVCVPAAGIDRFGQVLVLTTEKIVAPPPPPEAEEKLPKGKRRKVTAEPAAKESAGNRAAAGAKGAPDGTVAPGR